VGLHIHVPAHVVPESGVQDGLDICSGDEELSDEDAEDLDKLETFMARLSHVTD